MLNSLKFCDFTKSNATKEYKDILLQDCQKKEHQQFILAFTIYHESYGLSLILKEAIACTIANRIKNSNHANKTIDSICLDENFYQKLKNKLPGTTITNPEFAICSRLAGKVLRGILKDTTFGSTFYHHEDEFPELAEGKGYQTQIKQYLFYKI